LINYLFNVCQASQPEVEPVHTSRNHRQDASDTISKKDIETLIHTGEQFNEIEARVISEGSETRTYSHKLPESIRKNAALIDEKLAEITVCDPAVGSGAFPVGMMSEIVRARNMLSIFIHRQDACATTYDFKRRCIEHSLYGVDIDPGAVEIAKLRLWLSLVVDEDLPAPLQAFYIYIIRCDNNSFYIGQTEDIKKRWKEHCENKVSWTKKYKPIEIIHYEEYKTREEAVKRKKNLKTGFGRKWIRREFDKGQLRQWNDNAARQAGDIKNIKPLPNLDYKIVCGNSLLGVEKNLFNNELFTELEKLKPLFFNETNPGKKQEYKNQIDKLISEITNGYTEFDFEVYFSEVFHNKGGHVRRSGSGGGFDVVIANPPYGADLSKKEKTHLDVKFLKYKSNVKNSAIYFIYVSSEILNGRGINSFIVPKSLCYSAGWNKCASVVRLGLNKLIDTGKAFDEVKLEQVIFVRVHENSCSDYVNGIYDGYKLKEFAKVNKDIFEDHNVLLTGQTVEEMKLISKILNNCSSKWGDYVSIERGLNWQSKVIKGQGSIPIYRGAQLSPYFLDNPTDFIDVNRFNKNEYNYQFNPKILNQLAIAHVQNPYPHFYLQAALDFENKIVFETISCTFVKNDLLSIKFLLAINNSKLFAWLLYKFIYSNAIRSTRYDEQYVGKVPCPHFNKTNQKLFIQIVDRILAITKDDDYLQNSQKQTKVKALEREIDQLVYKLYGLTEEEIKIVEGENENAD